MLRPRCTLALRVAAVRALTTPSVPSETPSASSGSPSALPPRRQNSDADPTAAATPATPLTHHTPVQASTAARKAYGKEGFDFVETMRTSGPGAALGRVRWTLSLYIALGAVVVVYIVYYLTTYTYVLTNNPAPHRNTLFQHFPCDLAIIENKFTKERHVVEVTPLKEAAAGEMRDAPAPAPASATDAEGAAVPTHSAHLPTPVIVERKLYVNAVLHRVMLYLQKSHSLVLVDAEAELQPQRFMNRANSIGSDARAPVGFLRRDQLLPDAADADSSAGRGGAATLNSPSSWWPWGAKKKATAPSSAADAAAAAAARGPVQIFAESEVRLRDAMNGYQKGHLFTYEQTLAHVVQTKLVDRFYRYTLERGMAEHKGLRKVFAEELMRNGLISGTGVTLTMLVPDVQQFADEVFDDIKSKFGDDVIVYTYAVKLR